MQMTLQEMGREYLRQHDMIRKRIAELRATEPGLSPKKKLKLRSRILALYADAASLKSIGTHLINYYGESA